MFVLGTPTEKLTPASEPLELRSPYPFTSEYVNKAPRQYAVCSLLDVDQYPVKVFSGTLPDSIWREASLKPEGTVRCFVIEKIDGIIRDMEDYVEVLNARYRLLPEKPKRQIGFRYV
jgi:hypothetical protein